jgi:thioredoxin-dependent peroxiredoxin
VVAEGALAPDFTLPTDTGAPLTLSALRGRPVVLYFYPKDDTETCTVEACEFRDAFPRFRRSKAVVIGVSPDSVRSHARFKAKHGLPFTLVADTDHAVCEAYGVWREKTLFGRTYMGVVRTTFLIDAEGRVARVFEVTRAAGHAAEVAAAIKALGTEPAPSPRRTTKGRMG